MYRHRAWNEMSCSRGRNKRKQCNGKHFGVQITSGCGFHSERYVMYCASVTAKTASRHECAIV